MPDAIKKYKKSYVDKDEDEEDEKSLGTAAAMHALKLFNNGETGDKQGKGAFLGLALSEASKVCMRRSYRVWRTDPLSTPTCFRLCDG